MEINAPFDVSEPLKCMTWVLRVSIHCEGCKKKVKKVLQSIEGVYKVDVVSQQHKVVITGNVDSETLIKKLVKSGKQAELWPCDYSDKEENKSGKSKKKKKKQQEGPQATKHDENDAGDDVNIKLVEEGENTTKHEGDIGIESQKGKIEEQVEVDTQSGGGEGNNVGKKNKKKGKKGNISAGGTSYGGSPANTGSTPIVDQVNLNPPNEHVFYHTQFYYGVPEYGMSYNTAPATASNATSYYALPVQYNTYSSPHYVGPSPPFDREVDTNFHGDYYREDESGCSIM